MSEQITEILQRALVVSTTRWAFSTPAEITEHVNTLLDSAYSRKVVADFMKVCGWQGCGTSRAKRNKRACGYYFKNDRKNKALLEPKNSKSQSHSTNQSSADDESETLAAIDRRFRRARASKEQNLSDIRKVEVKTASHREIHLRLSYEKERKELLSVAEVKRSWETALINLKNGLYSLPLKLSARFASCESEVEIHDDFIKELDALCERLCRAEKEATVPEKDRLET